MPAPWTGEALEQPGTKRDSQWVLVNVSQGALLLRGHHSILAHVGLGWAAGVSPGRAEAAQ